MGWDQYPANDPVRTDLVAKSKAATDIIEGYGRRRQPNFEITEAGEVRPITEEGKRTWERWDRIQEIASMERLPKFVEMLKRAVWVKGPDGNTLLTHDLIDRINELTSATGLAILGTVLAAWGASHYFGVGEIADVILAIVGYALLGTDALLITKDLYVGTKLALDAQTDDDFDKAANAFAHGLSTAATDVAALGAGKVAGKVAGEVVSPTKQLVKQIGDKGLQPFLREGTAGFGRRFHAFWLDDTGTLWLDKHSRALNRILHSHKLTLTAQAAAKLEEAANAGKMKTTQEALGTFREILEKEGLDWSKLSDKAQAEVEAIAKEFAAPGYPSGGPQVLAFGVLQGKTAGLTGGPKRRKVARFSTGTNEAGAEQHRNARA